MANTVLIVLGMAGSGKSTFCHRLHSWLSGSNPKINSKTGLNDKVCGINLDPAVNEVKMPVHYDIRNTIDIDELMQKKQLGPNGAILTALNLFAAHIDVLISQIEELQPEYTIIDTPGQIEMFTTSVSGQIITQCLSGTKGVQVKMVYVVDGEKAQHPQCFISNMLFATSIHYRFKEQLLVAVNKSDIEGAEKIKKWAGDFESFSEALPEEGTNTPLTQSIALWLEEFYSNFNLFYISAATGLGKASFIAEVNRKEEDPGKEETEEIISSTEHSESQDDSDLPEAPASVIESIIETLKKTTILCDKPSADASISADEESTESKKEEKSSAEEADREEENHTNSTQNTQKIE